MSEIDNGFVPLVSGEPKLLILGTLPSQRSLSSQQYYGHPQNAFWWIMAQVFGFSSQASYAQRTEFLCQEGIAVWDVIERCARPGSIDANIDQSTLVANNFPFFFRQHPSIEKICFNGQAAGKLFAKHVEEATVLKTQVLPSTSPAHARLSRQQKLGLWRDAMAEVLPVADRVSEN